MADGRNIDNLNIKVTADTTNAVNNLSRLQETAKNMKMPTTGVRQAGSEVDSTTSKMASAFDRLGGVADKISAKFRSFQGRVKQGLVDKNIATYKGEMATLDAQIKKTSAQYEALKTKIANFKFTGAKGEMGRFQNLQNDLSRLEQYRAQLEQERNALLQSGNFQIRFNTEGFKAKISEVSARVRSFGAKLMGLSDKAREFGKRMFSAINPLKRFGDNSKKAAISSNLLARALGKTWMMLKRLVTRMILRGMITAVREGFRNLAMYSDEVNSKISRIGASLIQLKNAFAVAFMPLISFVTPALEHIIDLISLAFNKMGEFFSALTGKSSYIGTLKPAYDYAKSVAEKTGDTAKATNKIKKNAKEIKNATIGIDNLNVIEPKDNTVQSPSGAGGGGNNTPNVADMFTTKKVGKQMKKIANMVKKVAKKLFNPIKEAWKSQSKNIISNWKYALKEMLKLAKDVGKDFLKVWDSKQTKNIFDDLFIAVADMGLVVGNLAKNFRKAWNTNKVGLGIFKAIRSILKVISSGIKECADKTVEWSKKIDFYPLLKQTKRLLVSMKKPIQFIVNVLKGFYTKFVLPIVEWLIETAIPKIEGAITDFNNKVDWDSMAKTFNRIVKASEKFVEGFGEGLISFFKSLAGISADGINALFGKKGAMTKFSKWLDEQDPEKIKAVGKAFGTFFGFLIIAKPVISVLGKLGKFVITVAPYGKAVLVALGNGFAKLGGGIKTFFSALGGADPAALAMIDSPAFVIAVDEIISKLEELINKCKPLKKVFDTIGDVWNNLWGGIFATGSVIIRFFINLVKVIGNILAIPLHAYNKLADVFNWEKIDLDFLKVDTDLDSYTKQFNDTFEDVTGKRLDANKKTEKKFLAVEKKMLKLSYDERKKRYGKIADLDFDKYENRVKLVKKEESILAKENRIANNKFVSDFKTAIALLPPDVKKAVEKITGNLDKVKDAQGVKTAVDKMRKNFDKLPESAKLVVSEITNKFNKLPKEKKINIKVEGTKKVEADLNKVASKKRVAKIEAKITNIGKKLSFNAEARIKKMYVPKIKFSFNAAKDLKKSANSYSLIPKTEFGKFRAISYDGLKADGGFPRLGSLYIAGESGSELVGNINGKTGVASNQEITGIKSAIDNQGSVERQLLIEQNNLLKAILEKDTDIKLDGKSVTEKVNKINARSGKTLRFA